MKNILCLHLNFSNQTYFYFLYICSFYSMLSTSLFVLTDWLNIELRTKQEEPSVRSDGLGYVLTSV